VKQFTSLLLFLAVFILTILDASSNQKSAPTHPPAYRDGTYRESVMGYDDIITVEITISGGRISRVQVIEHNESRPGWAPRQIPKRIRETQGTKGVDAVSGATLTSQAILKATEAALQKARLKEETKPAKSHLPSVPLWIIGTYDNDGEPRFRATGLAGMISISPARISVAMPPESPSSRNIREKKAFTAGMPSPKLWSDARKANPDLVSEKEFLTPAGFQSLKGKTVNAPFLEKMQTPLECRLVRIVKVEPVVLYIGEITNGGSNPKGEEKDFQPLLIVPRLSPAPPSGGNNREEESSTSKEND